jgi:hypothetical protein
MSITHNQIHALMLIALAICLTLSGLEPYDRTTWVLEIFPIMIAVPILLATYKKFPLTELLYWCIFVHALVLILGGAYSYATNRADLDQVRLVGTLQRVNAPYEGRRQFRDANISEQGTYWQTSATWDRVGARGAQLGATLSFQRGAFTPLISSPDGGTVDRVTDGVVPSPAADVVSTQWKAAARISAPLLTWGHTTHEFRAGVTASRSAAAAEILALPSVAELVGGLAARVWMPSQPTSSSQRSLLHAGAYVADRVALGSSLTLNAGLRFDASSGSSAGAATGIDWRTVSPRVSAQWGRGPIALFGGIGRYTDPLTLSLLGYGDRGEAVSDVYRWHDLNGNQAFDAGELGVLVSRMGRGSAVASIAPGLRAPRTTERTVGLELRHGQLMTFRVSAAWRTQSSLVGSINTGVPLSSYRVIQIPDAYEDWDGPADDQPLTVYDRLPESFGQDAYLLTNPDEGTTSHDGLEGTWELKTRRLLVLFGATAYRTRSRGGNLGFTIISIRVKPC